MARRKEDWIDQAADSWARIRRRILGLEEFVTAREMLGAIRSLTQRDVLNAKRPPGKPEQAWPEVYRGEPALFNRCYHCMRPELKDVIDAHYVARDTPEAKAAALYLTVPTFYRRLADAKTFVDAWFAANNLRIKRAKSAS